MCQYRKKEWNKKIWIAKKIGTKEVEEGYEIPIYEEPKMYMMNVQPLSSEAEIQEFGEYATGMQKAVIELDKYLGEFKEFDIAYLDGLTPYDKGGEIPIKVSELNAMTVGTANMLYVKNLVSGEVEYYLGRKANYRLYPPRNQNKVILLYFERLAGK